MKMQLNQESKLLSCSFYTSSYPWIDVLCDDWTRFCQEHGLIYERMIEIQANKMDFLNDLLDTGLVSRLSSLSAKESTMKKMQSHPCNSYGCKDSLSLSSTTSCILNSVCVAGLYPNIAFIVRPPKKFVEVMGANIERDLQAKELKVYVPIYSRGGSTSSDDQAEKLDRDLNVVLDSTPNMQRVLMHNSSVNRTNTVYSYSNYLVYAEKYTPPAQAGNAGNSPLYLQVTAEALPWALVLFTGRIQYDRKNRVLMIDDYVRCGSFLRSTDVVDYQCAGCILLSIDLLAQKRSTRCCLLCSKHWIAFYSKTARRVGRKVL
jgi:hypothetical protein